MRAFALLMELALAQTPVAVDYRHSPYLIRRGFVIIMPFVTKLTDAFCKLFS